MIKNRLKTVSLGDVLDYEQPTKYIVDNTDYDENNEIPVLTAGKTFLLGYTNETDNVFSNVPVIIFDDFTTDFKYVDFPFKVKSSAMKILKAKEDLADIKFLFYRMQRTGIDTELHKRYWISKYSKVKIQLPSLDQQKQIAKLLDTADTYRQKTKALIEKYDQLTQSLYLDMFGDPVTNPKGWEQKILGNLLEITSSKRIFKDEYVDHGIPFYRTKEIVELSKGNDISLELFISEGRYAEIKSKYDLPAIGDILLSAVGTIGIMWTVDTNKPFYFKDGNLVWLKSSILNEVNPTYLRMTLEHLIENEKFKLAEGGAYNALTIAKLKDFNVLLAPYKLQNQFAKRIQAIEAQKALAQQELEKVEELFNSLLQKAFKGELVL